MTSWEQALELGGLDAGHAASANEGLQVAKEDLAAQQAKAAAEQARLAAVCFACISCEAASDTALKGCNACRRSMGDEDLEWPRYCNKGCQKDHWQEHRDLQQQAGRRRSGGIQRVGMWVDER